MFSSLKNLITAPLTKYMFIAILVLSSALGGALYLSYKFYGDKAVAEQQSDQLAVIVKEEKEQTERAIQSGEIINESVSKVREGEKKIDKVVREAQEEVSKPTPSNPTEVNKDAKKDATEPCDDFLSDDDIRLLRQVHCVTDGDTSDCN